MKHILDPDNFERKEAIRFFSTFIDPYLSITSEVECTGAKEKAKSLGISFSLYYTHAMLKAANEIKEFKYRMDKEGNLLYYDILHILSIIRTGDNGIYNTVYLEYKDDLLSFAREAQKIIDKQTTAPSRYEDELHGTHEEDLGVFMISAVPTLSFTGISFAHQSPMGGYPLSLIGKMITREQKEYIPIAIKVNHAFVDGYHIDKFYARVGEILKA